MSHAPPKRPTARMPRSECGLALDGPPAVVEAAAVSDAIGGIALGPPRVSSSRWLYYDTQSTALARAGLTLCVGRKGEGFVQALEAREDPPIAGFFRRTPSRARLASPDPDLARIAHGGLAARVRELCAESALIAQLEVESALTTRRIALDGAAIDAGFAVGVARVGDGALPLARISLVLKSGAARALFRAALSILEKFPGLRPANDDGAGLLARLRGDVSRPAAMRRVALPKRATLNVLMEAALAECMRCVEHNEAAARREHETEGLHQMRVASRRLRSALRMFRDELPRERADWLRAALAPLADALGAVRDLDVFLALVAVCEASGAPPLDALRARVAHARAEALASATHLLDSPERARLDLELGLLVFGNDRRDSVRAERLARPAGEAARELAALADRRARKAGRAFAELRHEDVHRLRLRVKSARYAVELLAPLLPAKRSRRYVNRARALQDALGVESDAQRTRALAERFGDAGPGVEFLLGYSAGQVAAGRGERARAWRRFRTPRRPWA
ncbi:MAG TPA: CHAD domain-containing protein [Myxococcota bacterium]